MCEDLAHRRVNLNNILEACESQHKASILPPPAQVIRQLVEEVFHESVSLDIYLQYVPVCEHFSFSVSESEGLMICIMTKNVNDCKYQWFLFLQMDQGSLSDSNVPLSGRSQMIRERLHGEYACMLEL